jgi:hypothetical protein
MYLLKYETEEKLLSLTRRNFLIRGSLSLAAGAFSSALVQAKTKEGAPADFKDWKSVRRQFELAPDYIHFALFFWLPTQGLCVRR